jgi:hypothetical protein
VLNLYVFERNNSENINAVQGQGFTQISEFCFNYSAIFLVVVEDATSKSVCLIASLD